MEVDFLIVGGGLAGIHFAYQCQLNNKKFVVLDGNYPSSSNVAAGLYNPVILKRFTQAWHAKEQLKRFNEIYAGISSILNINIDVKLPLYRRFSSVEEQNLWFEASDQILLSPYLDTNIDFSTIYGIQSLYGFGKVNQTGYVDTKQLVNGFRDYLRSMQCFIEEKFAFSFVKIEEGYVFYKDLKAKHLVFAEGFGLVNNPYFNMLPLDGTKGETFLIECPDLELDVIVKGGVFIIPIGNHFFKVGATYNWSDKSNLPTEEGKQELLHQLNAILSLDYKVVSHSAGVRPTVKDRKPLLGTHPFYPNLHVLNGLGTRGVMLAPYLAKMLFDFIEYQKPLHHDVDIKRFRNIKWDIVPII